MANGHVANKSTVSIVRAFGNGLIDSAQVQVDSIVQIERQCPVLPQLARQAYLQCT